MGISRAAQTGTAVLLGMMAARAAPDAAATGPQAPQRPTFHSIAQLVEVDVRVTDENGRFVATLTRDDFEVFEDGRTQPIEALLVVSNWIPVTPADAAPRAGGANRISLPGSHAWVFAFDLQHLSPAGVTRTRDALVRFVDGEFADGHFGGVLAGVKMANGRLTTNRAELKAAVSAVQPAAEIRARALDLRDWPVFRSELEALRIDGAAGAATDRDLLEQVRERACRDKPEACRRSVRVEEDEAARRAGGGAVDRGTQRSISAEAEEHVRNEIRQKARRITTELRAAARQTLTTLRAVVSGLARLPDRKTVVLFSEGFFFDETTAELRETVAAAARAGVTFYSVDARGLHRFGDRLFDQPSAMELSSAGEAQFDEKSDGPNSLAVDTGGLALRNDNDFGRALGRVAADARSYYLLAYRPTNTAFDGTFRRIQVKVKRPSVLVRARAGYVATAPPETTVAPPRLPSVSSLPFLSSPRPTWLPFAGDSLLLPPPAAAGVRMSAEPALAPTRARLSPAERVLQLEPVTASADSTPAAEGWAAYARGDVEGAARLLSEAASDPGARPWVHYALGFARLAAGEAPAAARSWQQVRQAAPEFQPVYFDLADAYLRAGDDGGAVRILRDAQHRWPADAAVHNALGVVQVRRGALGDAVESFRRAVQIAPADPDGYFNLGRTHQMRYLQSRRYNAAIGRWFADERERNLAIASFRQCVALGGAHVTAARDALAALEWVR